MNTKQIDLAKEIFEMGVRMNQIMAEAMRLPNKEEQCTDSTNRKKTEASEDSSENANHQMTSTSTSLTT